ncbi:MAG: MFS transporter [Actinomycetota bacterium]
MAAICGGVGLHMPMFFGARDMHYQLVGMPWDRWMVLGMALMICGYAAVLYGLAPRFARGAAHGGDVELEALDDGKLRPAHIKLAVVLMLAIAVDTQKPFTFTFILPGVANEYDLRSPTHPAPGHLPVALFPFVAIIGTVLGSLIWGRLGDSIGRRASILLAATLFIGTAMCGAMPAFQWNLVACLIMGMSAGGLLPIAYALLAETMPARRRGQIVVLVAGLGTALGFLIASWSAHWLIPTFGWRIMWFFGVPTGLALILLNRYLPESPRFLFAHGHADEARAVLQRFGIVVKERDASSPQPVAPKAGFAAVFRSPFRVMTPVLIVYGLAWGLVNYGFLVWLPVYVSKNGVDAAHVTAILAKAALFAIPGSLVVSWLYGRWSSRGTLVLAATVEAGTLIAFAVHPDVVRNSAAFTGLIVLLLVSLWATVSAVAPYAAEIYPTAIRGAGSGVVAGATKLGGVLALGIAVVGLSPPSVAGAAVLGAVPAGLGALLLVLHGLETRGRRLEEIERSEAAPRAPRKRVVRFRGAEYPVIFPSWKDPRLHLSATFICLHTLGQVEFHFRLSIPQIVTPILTCAVMEVAYTFWKKRVVMWPASAMLTGNGIAFIMRVPGTEHGQWWSTRGLWVYAAVAAVSMLSKYLITWRGKHVFNPSNLGLVACFILLGSGRSEPLQFWWGPLSPALVVVLATIVAGAFIVLSRAGVLSVAVLFWATFASGMGILALSGHAFDANWHLGPVANGYFWSVLVTSPEVFIFLSFMITDPRTVPETARGRRIFAITIGLLASLLIAPMRTEFDAKVALLGSLTIVCAARPLLILARERFTLPTIRKPALRAGAAFGMAAFAGLVVVAGSPARSFARVSSSTSAAGVQLTIRHTVGVVSINQATGRQIAADAIDDLRLASQALAHRDAAAAKAFAAGSYLADLRSTIAASGDKSITVPSYRVSTISLALQHAVGQAPPTVVATVSGTVTQLTYASRNAMGTSGSSTPFMRTFQLALSGSRFLLVGTGSAQQAPPDRPATQAYATAPKGTAAFSSAVQLTNVAPKLGLDFRQGAFRYGMADDPAAMMGGGVCWIDFNNDGWLDLFVVNSYADDNLPAWQQHGGLPRSALFENVHGKFVDVTAKSHAGVQTRGTGCVAADFNGDGRTDLFITTATDDVLLWNNGNGTFTQQDRSLGLVSYGWHAGAAVADVNGDGRPDLFVAGYTNVNAPIPSSVAGFPTNYEGIRDELFLNEGNAKNGHARFKEVGVQAGLEASHFRHGLGAIFTDVNGDGRPDLYVANDEDPNQLYINERGGPLGFHFVDEAKALGVADPNAGMGVAEGDYNGDGLPDLFITNSRGQPHAAYQSKLAGGERAFTPEAAMFGKALERTGTVGWGDSWVDLANNGNLDLVLANGAIPVTSLKKDTEPMQVLQGLGAGRFTLATGVIKAQGMPKIIGRGLAAADVDNDGRMAIAVNTIGGPFVLLENSGKVGNWLEVSLKGFNPGAVVTATLPDGKRIVQELHAGSSYLSSEDPRAHFGLGTQTAVKLLTVRYPDGTVKRLHDLRANRIVSVG